MSSPLWLDRQQYPFQPHYLALPMGRMHYVDEGQGSPVVMVHGTPTWSFLYRYLLRGLSGSHRVVAPDHIGFGLSDKPAQWSYRPKDHAENLAALIRQLGLRDITLVVHDFGGPIGLSYALAEPENVKALVLFNTWMWSMRDNRQAATMGRVMSGPVGRYLYKQLNFSPRFIVKAAMGDKSKLSDAVHQHYIRPFPTPQDRQGAWAFARAVLGSTDWYEQLWSGRDRIKDKPALIMWGMKDPAFRPDYLERWTGLFTHAQVLRFPRAGHFVQEEEREQLVPVVERFLASTGAPATV